MTDNLDALRHIEGFPIGEDEDILALSDPPHYTAYPNPHIAEFIAQHGKPYDEATDTFHREPYVADVSEGKNDPIYNAHSYHTKVPYKAIIPFIEHYTEPGDIVFDGFCGTGMTGVAAQMVGRRAILCDLSPAATFIAYNYNTPVDVEAFERETKRILAGMEQECVWMYSTDHTDGTKGRIKYTIWSDIFLCPYCRGQIVFWTAAVDPVTSEVADSFLCPTCGAEVTRRSLTRAVKVSYDEVVGSLVEHSSHIPVLIHYSVGRKHFQKRPDSRDLALLDTIETRTIPYWFPTDPMMHRGAQWGDTWRAGVHFGITHVHHFFTQRDLWVLGYLSNEIAKTKDTRVQSCLLFAITSMLVYNSKLVRFRKGNKSGPLSGTMYVSSVVMPLDAFTIVSKRFQRIAEIKGQASDRLAGDGVSVTTQSATDLRQVLNDSVDYIFTDPPFGDNLIYSELSFIWEAWLRVFTRNRHEAIISKSQGKALEEYRVLMTNCFSEMYRVLKPGRWITVVFHNSRASVWNAIQEALTRAGFVVAQVSVMDKVQGSFKQITSAGAVKNDLIINAYKPRHFFETQLIASAGVGQERAFIKHHLDMLPITPNIERTREMLYSKLLAYYVQHGYQIQYNADQFYRLLDREFPEADGYYFRDEAQRGEYEARKLKLKQKELAQAPIFVLDERSALQWLWHFLDQPRSYSDIYTAYVKALQAREDEIPELRTLLDENFVRSNGDYRRPDASTKQELEQKRQSRLLRDFDDYLLQARAGRKLKDVRKEAVIAGFTQAYRQQRFADILAVGRKLDKKLVEASTEVFDFMDIAEAKVEK